MANQMRGRVYQIMEPETNGNFTKQSIVLDCTTYDQYTGEPRPNFPKIEFNGSKMVDVITDLELQVGDIVVVSFVLKGRYYTNRAGEEVNATYVQGYKIEPVEQKSAPAPAQAPAPSPAPAPAHVGPMPQSGNQLPPMPTSEPDFGPAPIDDEKDPF